MASKSPIITPELIDYLERMFPDRCPEPMDPERNIWMAAGAVGVVRHLKRLLEEQEENILEV